LKKDFEENSIESLSNAFQKGASGVELDVFYDQTLGKFVVSHDEPSDTKNGETLYLDTVFSSMGSRGFLGIDFKNLTASNTAASGTRLLELFEIYNIGQKVFVEGGDPTTLRRFASSRIKTVLPLQAWGGL
jgi:glycerophosphoryl diester phosphodiesterase